MTFEFSTRKKNFVCKKRFMFYPAARARNIKENADFVCNKYFNMKFLVQ
jgi:hypothetical protein